MISAKVIAHSQHEKTGDQLVTFEVEFHRFILAELNKHRAFSNNIQSSRAVPTKTLLRHLRDDPAMPVKFAANQPGMSAGSALSSGKARLARVAWRGAASLACLASLALRALGVHKQWTNRLLEPFLYTRGVITTSMPGLANFFNLRLAKDAQPEIRALAGEMFLAFAASVPVRLQIGQYHLPYVTQQERSTFQVDWALRASATRCAQVSYRKLDTSSAAVERIWHRLGLGQGTGTVHATPAEHQAKAVDPALPAKKNNGNLAPGWEQHRKLLSNEFNGYTDMEKWRDAALQTTQR